jgi:hypothetical protein
MAGHSSQILSAVWLLCYDKCLFKFAKKNRSHGGYSMAIDERRGTARAVRLEIPSIVKLRWQKPNDACPHILA